MSEYNFYREKNKDLLKLVRSVSSLIANDGQLDKHAEDYSIAMQKLNEAVQNKHIDDEGKKFFLHLLNSHDKYTVKLTETYIREMSKLNTIVESYSESFSSANQIIITKIILTTVSKCKKQK